MLTDKDGLALRPYQVKAIQAAEEAIDQGQERILLAMATGDGGIIVPSQAKTA